MKRYIKITMFHWDISVRATFKNVQIRCKFFLFMNYKYNLTVIAHSIEFIIHDNNNHPFSFELR